MKSYAEVVEWLEPRVTMLPDAPGCWLWEGSRFPGGYGSMTCREIGAGPQGVHRIVYTWLFGDPGALHVLHTCATPPCARPSHLYKGAREQNMRDRTDQGRYHRLSSYDRLGVYKAIVDSGEDPVKVALAYGISSRHAYRIAGARVSWAGGPGVNYSKGEAHGAIIRAAWARRKAKEQLA